jgi:hypothetical protein
VSELLTGFGCQLFGRHSPRTSQLKWMGCRQIDVVSIDEVGRGRCLNKLQLARCATVHSHIWLSATPSVDIAKSLSSIKECTHENDAYSGHGHVLRMQKHSESSDVLPGNEVPRGLDRSQSHLSQRKDIIMPIPCSGSYERTLLNCYGYQIRTISIMVLPGLLKAQCKPILVSE